MCNKDYAESGGDTGIALAYQRATSSRKHIWCSDAFKNKHIELWAIINAMLVLPGNMWRLAPSEEEFLAVVLKKMKQKRDSDTVCLLAKAELKSKEPRRLLAAVQICQFQ